MFTPANLNKHPTAHKVLSFSACASRLGSKRKEDGTYVYRARDKAYLPVASIDLYLGDSEYHIGECFCPSNICSLLTATISDFVIQGKIPVNDHSISWIKRQEEMDDFFYKGDMDFMTDEEIEEYLAKRFFNEN